MQPSRVRDVRKDHLAGLRHTCRAGPRSGAGGGALCLRQRALAARRLVPAASRPVIRMTTDPVRSRSVRSRTGGSRTGRAHSVGSHSGRSESRSLVPEHPTPEHPTPGQPAPEPPSDAFLRIPRIDGLDPAKVSPAPARWRASWSLRHTLATVGLAPVVYAAYRGALGPAAEGSPLWAPALLLLATMGAVVLATYVPPRSGLRVTRSSPCAAGAGVHVILAGLVLSTVFPPASGVLALGLLAFAVRQRLGSAACAVGVS